MTEQVNAKAKYGKWVYLLRALPWLQGAYYLIFGIWSLLSITSFMDLTGPKNDVWLVKTVGSLLIVSGLAIIAAAVRKRMPIEIVIVGAGNAIALAGIDLVYVFTKTIPAIYMLDAAVEIVFAVCWIFRFGQRP